MANYLELTGGGPDVIRAIGALLRARGDELDARGRAILSRIQALEAGAPWGTDDYGRNITDFYLADLDGHPANETMKKWLTENGPALTQLGDALVAAMQDLQGAELENLLSLAEYYLDGQAGPA